MTRKDKSNRQLWATYKDTDGYIRVKIPYHPQANNRGYVPQHRLVMEQALGRLLTNKEQVHHINEIRDDNRVENLYLCSGVREHSLIHRPPRFCHCGEKHFGHGFCAKHYREWYTENVWKKSATCEQCGKAMRPTAYICKDKRKLCRQCRYPEKTICSQPNCHKPSKVKGLCGAHYNDRFRIPCSCCGRPIRKTGRNVVPAVCWDCKFPKRVCQICGKPNDGLDLCMNHYAQFKRWRKKQPSLTRDDFVQLLK